MHTYLEKIMLIVEPLALVVLLVYIYGYFGRSARPAHHVNAIMGCVFGFAAVVAMSFPIPIADGIIVDMRNLFVGIAAAFFGPVGGGIAFACGAVARIIIGGDGMVIGLMGLMVASAMGIAWSTYCQPALKTHTSAYLVLGLMISTHLLIALLMPPTIRDAFLRNLAPVLLAGNLVGSVLLGMLITRERRILVETQLLSQERNTDELTSLMNRNAAMAAYEVLPAKYKQGRGLAMLCIDIDKFKQVNDTYGHLIGDDVLVEIADRLRSCLRENDIFARMSGDEFLIVLTDLTEYNARVIARRCRKVVGGSPVVTHDTLIPVSISVGCGWVQAKVPFDSFRRIADDALYDAKANGRDCVVTAA